MRGHKTCFRSGCRVRAPVRRQAGVALMSPVMVMMMMMTGEKTKAATEMAILPACCRSNSSPVLAAGLMTLSPSAAKPSYIWNFLYDFKENVSEVPNEGCRLLISSIMN